MHRVLAPLIVVSLAACGGNVTKNEEPTQPASDNDTGTAEETAVDTGTPDTEPPRDHGAPSMTFPAFEPDMAQLVDKGGGVLTAPVLVTVTFPGDMNAAAYEEFGDELGATQYWKDVVSEYGVGPATSGPTNHVRETTLPAATWADWEIGDWIAEHAGNAEKYGWPKPTKQSIYTIYVPNTTKVMLDGADACSQGVGGYHTSAVVGDIDVAYAIILQCKYGSKATTPRTVTASHEIGEAATDPHPQTGTIVAERPRLKIAALPFDLRGSAMELLWRTALDDDGALRFATGHIEAIAKRLTR